METKITKDVVERVHSRIGFTNCFLVNPIGRGGGLAMFSNEDINFDVVNYSNYHIHTRI